MKRLLTLTAALSVITSAAHAELPALRGPVTGPADRAAPAMIRPLSVYGMSFEPILIFLFVGIASLAAAEFNRENDDPSSP